MRFLKCSALTLFVCLLPTLGFANDFGSPGAVSPATQKAMDNDPMSNILGGDEGDACEMIMCLSNPVGDTLKECEEPIRKYFKMKSQDRPGFLEKCPIVGGDD